MHLLVHSAAMGFVHTIEHMSETTENKEENQWRVGEEVEVLQGEGEPRKGPGATSMAVTRDAEMHGAWRSGVGMAIQDHGEPNV